MLGANRADMATTLIPQFFSNSYILISIIAISLFFVSFFSTTSQVQAQLPQQIVGFYANLSGNEEVPPTESNATGLSVFLFNNESSQVSYLVNTTGLEKISQSHIYNGSAGINGEAVAPLSDEKSVDDEKNSSIMFQGEIKKDDLHGTLDGKQIEDLVTLMSNGSAYVNIHTDQYPDGEIRGQLVMGEVQMNGSAITGLAFPGGLIGLTGVSLQGGLISFSQGSLVYFLPIPVEGGSQIVDGNGNIIDGIEDGNGNIIDESGNIIGNVNDGVHRVVGQVGGTVDKTVNEISGTVSKASEYVGEAVGTVANTADDVTNKLDNTVEKIDEGIVQKLLDDDDGDSKDDDDGDSKDDDDGDSKDDDDGDSKDDDDGDSVKDKVDRVLS
jgi:hypothetical protein